MSGMSEPIREPGWYRILSWEPVTEEQALKEINAGHGESLILIKSPGPGRAYQSSEAM